MLKITACLLALYALIVSCNAAIMPKLIMTPISRRQIPESAIRESPLSKLGVQIKTEDVYEVSDDGMLTGINLTADIATGARPVTDPEEDEPFMLIVNGKEVSNEEVDRVVIHEVNGFEVMYDDEGKVDQLWSDNLFLVQFDRQNFPGVFVNVHNSHSEENDVIKIEIDREEHLQTKESRYNDVNGVDRQGACRRVDVAVAYDNTFCEVYGNNLASRATRVVRRTVRQANRRFRNDMCHRIRSPVIEAHCQDPNDPYDYRPVIAQLSPGDRAIAILTRFRSFWLNSRAGVDRDVAVLFTGYEDFSSTAGIAFLDSACSSFGFAWDEGPAKAIFIHELGHTLGAEHTFAGIMRPVLSDPNAAFSQQSINEINSYLGSSDANCIA